MDSKNNKIRFAEERRAEAAIVPHFLESLFKNAEPFEEMYGKDLCNFSTKEIENMLKTHSYRSLRAAMVAKTHYKIYVDWCLEQGLVDDHQNHFAELSTDQMMRCLNKRYMDVRVISREEVLRWCDAVPNPSDCVILLGLFEGIRGRDFCEFTEMKEGDVDFDNGLIRLEGRERPFKASVTLTGYIKEACETEAYYPLVADPKKTFGLIPSDNVIKNYPNIKPGEVSQFRKGRRIYTRLSKIFEFLDVAEWMNAMALVTSGIIHMINEESGKRNISADEYLRQYKEEIDNQFNMKLDVYLLRKEYGDYFVQGKRENV